MENKNLQNQYNKQFEDFYCYIDTEKCGTEGIDGHYSTDLEIYNYKILKGFRVVKFGDQHYLFEIPFNFVVLPTYTKVKDKINSNTEMYKLRVVDAKYTDYKVVCSIEKTNITEKFDKEKINTFERLTPKSYFARKQRLIDKRIKNKKDKMVEGTK